MFFVLLMLRALWLQTVGSGTYTENGYNPRAHPGAANRGDIVTRDGVVLATTIAGKRRYPLGGSLAQSVGYISSRYGTAGLESVYDSTLRPQSASESPLDRVREAIDRRSHHPTRHGGRLITTIDSKIQATLYESLRGYNHAAGVVLDAKTGAVVALTSLPSYDPNVLDNDFPRLVRDPESALLDRAIDGLYPPGSTFKIVTAAAALQAGTVTLDQTFQDPGYLDIGNFRVHDDQGEATGYQTLVGAFALSSNVDFAQIALTLGRKKFFDQMRAFKLGVSTGFTIPTALDHIPQADGMSDSELAQLAFGQSSLLVTPLRMALIAETVANQGVEMTPYLVENAVTADSVGHVTAPVELATPMTPATAAALTKLMVAVVNRGTGTAAALPTIQVAGKTGTATNPAGAPHSWFVGFAPADAPRYVVAVIVENGGYGGSVAAPVVRRVLAAALRG